MHSAMVPAAAGLIEAEAPQLLPHGFPDAAGQTDTLSYMLKKRRDPFPSTIYYKTRDHRHLQAYWIKLDGIRFGKKEATIRAAITDYGLEIRCRNADGLTAELPPDCGIKKAFSFASTVRRSGCFRPEVPACICPGRRPAGSRTIGSPHRRAKRE